MLVRSQIYTGLTNVADGRPCEIGRLEYESGLVMLFHRYTDTLRDGSEKAIEEGSWRPTWVGNIQRDPQTKGAVKLPKGLVYAGGEALLHLSRADIISSDDMRVDTGRWM